MMKNKDQVEQRQDTWWITDNYLSLTANIVADQFVEDEDTPSYPSWEAFTERATYVMRQHCPIAYAYFFEATNGNEALPAGTLEVVLSIILARRPLFTIQGVQFEPVSGTH